MLVLQKDLKGKPIHVVWGISNNTDFPAVLVTAYRPIHNIGRMILIGGRNDEEEEYKNCEGRKLSGGG